MRQINFPNETAQYRQARNDLLKAEIELRQQIERVTAEKVLKLKPDFSLAEFAASQPYKDQQQLDRLLTPLKSAGLQ